MTGLRRVAVALTLFLVAATLSGCAGLQHRLLPGSLEKGSRIHAYQVAAFAQAFTASHARQWEATMRKLESEGIPLLKVLRKRKIKMDVALRGRAKSHTVIYDVDLHFKGKLMLHAEAGMAPEAYDAGATAVAKRLKLDVATLRSGHFAIYSTAAMMTALNVSATSLEKHAFALLVLRNKLRAGEQADYLSPTRPAEESLEDIEVALRVVASHHQTVAEWRAEVLGLVALIEAAETDVGLEALVEQAAESRERAGKWLRDNPRPTMEQFGVAMNELVLPTPEGLLSLLDENGYIAAAVQVAKSIATGDPRGTLEGLAKLAPKGTTVRTALDGLSAAANGDVKGVLGAVTKLAGKDSTVGKLVARVDGVYSAIVKMKGGIETIGATISKPSSLGDLSDRAGKALEGASDVKEGAGELTR